MKLDRDVASETVAVLIEAQTNNGIIEEPDLLQVIATERQIAAIDKPIKISDVADFTLLREVLSKER